jgi:hypothetical protein
MSDQSKQKPQSLEDIFGPPVFAYTRADAIADGVLVPIPELDAKLAGYSLPFVASATVYAVAQAEEFGMDCAASTMPHCVGEARCDGHRPRLL